MNSYLLNDLNLITLRKIIDLKSILSDFHELLKQSNFIMMNLTSKITQNSSFEKDYTTKIFFARTIWTPFFVNIKVPFLVFLNIILSMSLYGICGDFIFFFSGGKSLDVIHAIFSACIFWY